MLPASDTLAAILGVIRAGLLVHLAAPACSIELVAWLGVVTTAVSRRLQVLHAAGLVVSAQYGRSVS